MILSIILGCLLRTLADRCGIGKTALIKQLAAQIGDEFDRLGGELGDRVIWVNLRADRSVVELIVGVASPSENRDLLPYLSIELMTDRDWDLEQRISILMEQLSKYRCLIVLDDIQHLFNSGDLAGVYGDNYRDYQKLFKQFGDANHQSCILFIGWEEPRDFGLLAGESRLIRSFALDGLSIDAQQQLLQDRGIVNGDLCVEQLDYYAGNPSYLNILATITKDCFGGRIDVFLQDRRLFLTNDIKLVLQHQHDRLTEIERQVIETIIDLERAVSFPSLMAVSPITPANLLEALQSLRRRRLLQQQDIDGELLLDIQPIFRDFIVMLR